MSKILRGSLGAAVSARSHLVTELGRKLEERNRYDAELKKQLLEAAPKSVREWLVEDSVMSNLFEWGKSDRKISFNTAPFGSLADIRRVMAKLRTAWAGVVLINLDEKPEPHRVQVWFTAVF